MPEHLGDGLVSEEDREGPQGSGLTTRDLGSGLTTGKSRKVPGGP